MKKILKGISLFAITIIAGCLFINCVNAETRYGSVHTSGVTTGVTMTDKTTDTSRTFSDYGQLIVRYDSSGNLTDEYHGADTEFYLHNEVGTGLSIYCLDANLSGANLRLRAKRFLLDNSLEPNVYSYDLAVMSVLLSDAPYEIKSVVLRALTATWNHGISGGYVGIDQATIALTNAYYGLAREWINEDGSIRENYEIILNSFSSGIINSLSTLASRSDGYSFNQAMTNRALAKQLYADALEIAADYLQSDGQPSVKVENGADWSTFRTEDASYGEYHNYQITRIFTLSNFTNDGEASFVIDSLEYDLPLEELGVIDQPRFESIKINGTEYIDSFGGRGSYGAIGQNLLEPLNSSQSITDEVVIEVTIEFFGATNVDEADQDIYGDLNCGTQPMDWTLNYTYNDTGINGIFSDYLGIVWEATKTGSDTPYQRFITVEPIQDTGEEEVGIEGTITGSVELMDACNCDDYIEACIASGNINSAECNELFEANCGECAELQVRCEFGDEEACREYNETCDVDCGTTVDMFECCDAEGELLLISQYNDNNSTHPVNINGPENVVACFVSQIDGQRDPESGYSDVEGARDDVSNLYTQEKNKYCLVSCKEDYAMEMPTAKLVNAGRYFTFRAAIEGTKTCYTNTIDRELYNEDIIEAQKNLVDAYNTYRQWYELYHNGTITPVSGSYTSSCSCSSRGCISCSSSTYYPRWQATATVSDWQTVTSENDSTGQISTRSGSHGVSATYTYQTPTGSQRQSCPGGSWSVRVCQSRDEDGKCTSWGSSRRSCAASSRTYYTGTRVVNTESDFRNYLRQQMNTAENNLSRAQQAFEDVIELYNSCSDWDSEISFDSDNPLLVYDYEEDYMSDLDNDYGSMDSSIGNIDNTNWYCNSQYLTNGSVVQQAELMGSSYSQCSSSVSNSTQYTAINYTYCTTDGCTNRHQENVSNASYKKITSTVNATYVPSTLFYNDYPSGNVGKIGDEGINGATNPIDLENSLPVELDTGRGIYEYSIKIDNLGEYYDSEDIGRYGVNGNMGRLIGGGNPVINRGDYAEFFDEDGNVQYICAYLVNMGTIDDNFRVVCDWDNCEDGDCTSNCIGPNCDEVCYGDDCVSNCIGAGCLYDDDAGQQYNERVVSLNNMFPNGTNSYNWTNEKGEATIEEIEKTNDPNSDPDSIFDEDPILSVTIDRDTAVAILEYNERADDRDGGYSNATLTCTSVGGYSMIGCYSSFIEDLLKGRLRYGNTIINSNLGNIVNDRSLILNDNYRDNSSNYFELWDNVDADHMMGPSWK